MEERVRLWGRSCCVSGLRAQCPLLAPRLQSESAACVCRREDGRTGGTWGFSGSGLGDGPASMLHLFCKCKGQDGDACARLGRCL